MILITSGFLVSVHDKRLRLSIFQALLVIIS